MPFEVDSLSYDRPEQVVPQDSRQVKLYNLGENCDGEPVSPLDAPLNSPYKRVVNQVRPTRLYIIISGGELKERHYFSNLGRIVPIGCAIPLYFICPTGIKSGRNHAPHRGSSPQDIFDYWKAHYQTATNSLTLLGRTYHLTENDRVYFVSDVDEFSLELQSLLKVDTPPFVRWAISNPCVEVWLYYSCIGVPSKDHCQLLENESISKRSQKLKSLCNEHKGGIDPRKAPAVITTAIANARSFGYKEDEQGIPLLFCSSLLHFAEEFMEYLSTFE